MMLASFDTPHSFIHSKVGPPALLSVFSEAIDESKLVKVKRRFGLIPKLKDTAEARLSGRAMQQIRLIVLLLVVTIAPFSQPLTLSAEANLKSPDLNLILQTLESVEQQNPARSRPYELTREYKAFRADDKKPTAEITAQINFTPPNRKTFKILQASGNARGEKIVRDLLKQETEPVREGHDRDINRTNYDFVFLRQEDFGLIPEYVLRIVPKRKEKGLILGQIWVDAKTFRIRRIEGVPAKSPSIWIKNSYIMLQFAEVNEMWITVSLDAIATVRLLGRYTLTGLYVGREAPSPPQQKTR